LGQLTADQAGHFNAAKGDAYLRRRNYADTELTTD
jgi:hypothetical protein